MDRDPRPVDIAQLKTNAQNGDLSLLGKELHAMRPELTRIVKLQLGDKCPAGARKSDLLQKTYVLAIHRFNQWKGSTQAELRAWVSQILRNTMRQAVRAGEAGLRADRLTRPLVNDPESRGPSPSRLSAQRQGYRRIIAKLAQVRNKARQRALYLRLLEERSLEEISVELGKNQQAVASLIKHGLRQLRQLLAPQETGRQLRAPAARVDAALQSYLSKWDLGQRPDRAAFLAQHADCAHALAPLIDSLQMLDRELTGCA